MFCRLFLSLAVIIFLSCGRGPSQSEKHADENAGLTAEEIAEKQAPESPITFDKIPGKWILLYPNDYGYEFQLYRNYRALVILYLNNCALIFKGVYTLEDGNRLRLNISEMKRSQEVRAVNTYSGFAKAKSSYFLFRLSSTGEREKMKLVLRPLKIIIDGSDSDGYFEPILRLKRR